MRYKIELAYNGSNYHGWQIQPNAITVQEVLDKCISMLLNTPIETLGCGRTDTGVHAEYFVAHFDYDNEIDTEAFTYKLNRFLPIDIAIFKISKVSEEFHARFSAKSRTYEYKIHTSKDPFLNNCSWFYPRKLDVELMNKGCEILLQTSDFASFCKTGGNNLTTICKLYNAQFIQNDYKIVFNIKADRFLRNMVRAITGTLTELGCGKISINDLQKIVDNKQRCSAKQSAPAHALSLIFVEY